MLDIENVANRFPDNLFESLVGGEYDFYGVDGNAFCIGVNGSRILLEAVEDENDGYRSYFGCFKTSEVGKIFFCNPIARVRLLVGGLSSRTYYSLEPGDEGYSSSEEQHKKETNFNGWILKDADTGHVWLTVGTDHGEDYYPCFTFRYDPDPSKTVESSDDNVQ